MKHAGVLIVDDHGVVREGLRKLVESHPGLSVVGETGSGAEAVRLIQSRSPDLALVDLSMPDLPGVKVVEACKMLKPDARVIVVTAHCTGQHVHAALRAGADGYLVKTEEGADILKAINSVLKGHSYLSPEVTAIVARGYLHGCDEIDKEEEVQGPLKVLTPRELQLVRCVIAGETSGKGLAERLNISEKTVQKHKTSVFKKLEVSGLSELLVILSDYPSS